MVRRWRSGGCGKRRRRGRAAFLRRSSLLPASELPPLRGPPDLAWPPAWSRSPSLVVAGAAAASLCVLDARPSPRVAHPVCLPFAFEERGMAYLHRLSLRKGVCLPFCISCWRMNPDGTVASGRQICFCLPLLDSVLRTGGA
jgi:hypothetical protein